MALGLVAIALLVLGGLGLLDPWVADGGATLAFLLFAISVFFTLRRVRETAAVAGARALVGKVAVARTPLTPDGYIFIAGERWAAEIEEGSAAPGENVVITGHDGFRLRVRPAEAAPAEPVTEP